MITEEKIKEYVQNSKTEMRLQFEQMKMQRAFQYEMKLGEYRKAEAIAQNFLTEGISREDIQSLIGLSEKELKDNIEQNIDQVEQTEIKQDFEHGMRFGKALKAKAIARKLLAENISKQAIQKLTGLSEKDVMDLIISLKVNPPYIPNS